jgi:hypothetical protein
MAAILRRKKQAETAGSRLQHSERCLTRYRKIVTAVNRLLTDGKVHEWMACYAFNCGVRKAAARIVAAIKVGWASCTADDNSVSIHDAVRSGGFAR